MDEIQTLEGHQILPHLDAFGKLRTTIFREYPYLYDSNPEVEKSYLKNYAQCKDSLFIIATHQNKLIGCLSSIPFSNMAHESWAKILQSHFPIAPIFYLGDMLVLKEHRNRGLGTKMYNRFEEEIRKKQKFTQIAFIEVIRPNNDPKRPNDYHSLDAFWKKKGFIKHPELSSYISYKEIGKSTETDHAFLFQIKHLH
jgi:GNAT superfamily N-acetyltransferase